MSLLFIVDHMNFRNRAYNSINIRLVFSTISFYSFPVCNIYPIEHIHIHCLAPIRFSAVTRTEKVAFPLVICCRPEVVNRCARAVNQSVASSTFHHSPVNSKPHPTTHTTPTTPPRSPHNAVRLFSILD